MTPSFLPEEWAPFLEDPFPEDDFPVPSREESRAPVPEPLPPNPEEFPPPPPPVLTQAPDNGVFFGPPLRLCSTSGAKRPCSASMVRKVKMKES